MEVFDAVSGDSPAAEMGHAAAYYWKGKIAAALSLLRFHLDERPRDEWVASLRGRNRVVA